MTALALLVVGSTLGAVAGTSARPAQLQSMRPVHLATAHTSPTSTAESLPDGVPAGAGVVPEPDGSRVPDNSYVVWPEAAAGAADAPTQAPSGEDLPLPNVPSGWSIKAVYLKQGLRTRYYLVARPTTPTTGTLPVLMVLHGHDMTPATIARASGFLGVVGQAVVVYPAGFGESWNAGYCCGIAHLAGIDDVAFIKQVLQSVLSTQPDTSPAHAYLAGFSNGGRMAYLMACADPGAFAGVAAVEAVAVSSCSGPRTVPLIEVAMTHDPFLTVYNNQKPKHVAGHIEVTVQELVSQWQLLEGCESTSQVSTHGAMTLTEWGDCGARSRLAEAIYQGAGHHWPAGDSGTPSAEQVVWDFFQGLGSPPSPES